jgi:acetolactate synthase-1/3 small subunit
MRHIISLLVENEAGALSRISGLFSARGYNIESLTVATTEDQTLSRMTIITTGSDRIIEQITKQLNKLVDVVKLQDFTEGNFIEREMMFVKVKAEGESQRAEVKRLSDIFRARRQARRVHQGHARKQHRRGGTLRLHGNHAWRKSTDPVKALKIYS